MFAQICSLIARYISTVCAVAQFCNIASCSRLVLLAMVAAILLGDITETWISMKFNICFQLGPFFQWLETVGSIIY